MVAILSHSDVNPYNARLVTGHLQKHETSRDIFESCEDSVDKSYFHLRQIIHTMRYQKSTLKDTLKECQKTAKCLTSP